MKRYYIFIDETEIREGKQVLLSSLIIEKKEFDRISRQIKKTNELPEIHFVDLDKNSGVKRKIAFDYCNLVRDATKNHEAFILFCIVDKNKLEKNLFGKGKERHKNIYKRFIRLGITYVTQRFVRKYGNIEILGIFIDSGNQSEDKYFVKFATEKIKTKSKAKLPEEIEFIDSDHHNVDDSLFHFSVFVQMADLFLGAFRNSTTRKTFKRSLKEDITNELVDFFISGMRKNCDRCKVSTFPKVKNISSFMNKTLENIEREIRKVKYEDDAEIIKTIQPMFTRSLGDYEK